MNKKVQVFCEGDHDRAIVEALQREGLLPTLISAPKPKRQSTEGLEGIAAALAFHANAGESAVAIVDRDDLSPGGAAEAILGRVRRKNSKLTTDSAIERDGVWITTIRGGDNGDVTVRVVVAGLEGDSVLSVFKLQRWMFDDYVLRMMLDSQVFKAFVRSEDVVQDHALVVRKLSEVRILFEANGMPLTSSKRWLHILRATIGYQASPATANSDLVSRSFHAMGGRAVRQHFEPWISELTTAVSAPWP